MRRLPNAMAAVTRPGLRLQRGRRDRIWRLVGRNQPARTSRCHGLADVPGAPILRPRRLPSISVRKFRLSRPGRLGRLDPPGLLGRLFPAGHVQHGLCLASGWLSIQHVVERLALVRDAPPLATRVSACGGRRRRRFAWGPPPARAAGDNTPLRTCRCACAAASAAASAAAGAAAAAVGDCAKPSAGTRCPSNIGGSSTSSSSSSGEQLSKGFATRRCRLARMAAREATFVASEAKRTPGETELSESRLPFARLQKRLMRSAASSSRCFKYNKATVFMNSRIVPRT